MKRIAQPQWLLNSLIASALLLIGFSSQSFAQPQPPKTGNGHQMTPAPVAPPPDPYTTEGPADPPKADKMDKTSMLWYLQYRGAKSLGQMNGDSPDPFNITYSNIPVPVGGAFEPDDKTLPNPALIGLSKVMLIDPANWLTRHTDQSKAYQAKMQQLGRMNEQLMADPVQANQAGVDEEVERQHHANAARPLQQAHAAGEALHGGALAGADIAGEIGDDMAEVAIQYVSQVIYNFTVEKNNVWNQLRNEIFVPIGILLLLPGAVLSQVRAIVSSGNPVLGQVNPFDGILRSLVGIFFLPGTYLVVNYGIDVANSLTFTIADEYARIVGGDMYKDAICHEIKAMPWRLPEENRGTIDIKMSSMGQILMGNNTPFAQTEADLFAVKINDPCAGIYIVPPDRANEVQPAAAAVARTVANTTNAGLVTSWSVLCAFQVAYLYYLWCVGPVVAGLWVWPMKQLRDALPSWVEGVVSVCFWALFWNTVILLMALFKGVDETGTFMMLVLNSLANLAAKFAFDFASLMRAAVDEALKFGKNLAEKAKEGGGGGGGKGGGQDDSGKGKDKGGGPDGGSKGGGRHAGPSQPQIVEQRTQSPGKMKTGSSTLNVNEQRPHTGNVSQARSPLSNESDAGEDESQPVTTEAKASVSPKNQALDVPPPPVALAKPAVRRNAPGGEPPPDDEETAGDSEKPAAKPGASQPDEPAVIIAATAPDSKFAAEGQSSDEVKEGKAESSGKEGQTGLPPLAGAEKSPGAAKAKKRKRAKVPGQESSEEEEDSSESGSEEPEKEGHSQTNSQDDGGVTT